MLPPDCELLLLDQALEELSSLDPHQGRIVEMRYFAGLSEGEVAEVLSVSRSTVTRSTSNRRSALRQHPTH